MIGKDRIVFDVGAIAHADNVGAYVRSGRGGSLVTNHALADSNPGISFVFVDGDISADTITADGSGNHTLTTFAVARRALDVYVNNPLEIDVGLDAGDDSVSAWLKD